MGYNSNLLNSSISSLMQKDISIANTPSLMMLKPETEPVIEIDSDLREITVPKALYNIAVCGDHMSETVYFSCPRYFDDNDLSEHKCIICFTNAGNEYGESDAVDMTLNADSLSFGWKIDNNATRFSGEINFVVAFETASNYRWGTKPARLNILAGLNIEETITEKDNVLFRTLTNQIQSLQKTVAELQAQIDRMSNLDSRVTELENDVNYLEENVVYTLVE